MNDFWRSNNIVFISSHNDLEMGSYRIWIHDLNYYFGEIGIASSINGPITNGRSIVIVGKNDSSRIDELRRK